jgi:hypothetical protein
MSETPTKCFNCKKRAMYFTPENHPLCLDCYHKWQDIADRRIAYMESFLNHADDEIRYAILGGEPPRLNTSFPIRATINQGDIHMNNINISGSTVGMLNTGNIQDVKNIDVNITSLINTGNEEVANALKKITEAVAENVDISDGDKSEILDQLNELSGQAAISPEKRAKPGVIKAIVKGLAASLGAAGGLAEVWTLTGKVICAYFGIANPF